MPHFICVTCGSEHAESGQPPARCPICEDERQWVPPGGQQWTTLADLRRTHHNRGTREEPGLTSIMTDPKFAIGQRALLVETPGGNILWDCLSLINTACVEYVERRGGLAGIAVSHPHYYGSMVEWSQLFGGVPIYLHAADREWVQRPDPAIVFWEGARHTLGEGLTLVRCGGHFPGGAVLHWAAGAGGRGALLTGDVIQVVPNRKLVSFMYSYPNYIPLDEESVRRIWNAVAPLGFDRIYGAWPDSTIFSGARQVVEYSVERYLRALGATTAHATHATAG